MSTNNTAFVEAASYNGYAIDPDKITLFDGLAKTNYRHSRTNRAGVRGSLFHGSLMDMRVLDIRWLIDSYQGATFMANRQAVNDAFNVDTITEPLPLLLTLADGQQYAIYCVPDTTPVIPTGTLVTPRVEVQAVLQADDPVIYSAQQMSSGRFNVRGQGGAAFPLVFPIVFDVSNTGIVSIYNEGNVAVPFILNLHGQFTNPNLVNLTTNQSLKITRTTLDTDLLVVDFGKHTVVLNNAVNAYPNVVAPPVWWQLQPGLNRIQVITDSADTGQAEVLYQSGWNSR